MNRGQFNSHWGLRKFSNRKILDGQIGSLPHSTPGSVLLAYKLHLPVLRLYFIRTVYNVFLKIRECIYKKKLVVIYNDLSMGVVTISQRLVLQKRIHFTAIEVYHASMVLSSTNRQFFFFVTRMDTQSAAKNRSYVRKVDRQ